jgi:hypothetical protein
MRFYSDCGSDIRNIVLCSACRTLEQQKALLCEGLANHKKLCSGKYILKKVPLLNPEKVLQPPLHIKFGRMNNFVKAFGKGAEGIL